MNPQTACFCHPILSMISTSVAPFLRRSMGTTWAVLLPSRGAVSSCVLVARLPWGALLASVAFPVALAVWIPDDADQGYELNKRAGIHEGLRLS